MSFYCALISKYSNYKWSEYFDIMEKTYFYMGDFIVTRAKELLKQRYYKPIKDHPELFVEIELEYPVVNLSVNATDVSLSK